MSTFNSAVFAEADDEHDPDFVPSEESSESSDEEAEKTAEQPILKPEDLEAERVAKEAARASLWADFQSSVAAPSSTSLSNGSKQAKTVKVVKKYIFAGEEVSEIIEVPKDSEDAKRWPLWNPSMPARIEEKQTSNRMAHDIANDPSLSNTADVATKTLEEAVPATAPTTTDGAKPWSSSAAEPPRRRPGPRKPKTTLAPLPSGKPKKMTTLEKSAMDWRAHVSQATSGTETPPGAESLADELERNRRSGGYLEKVAFLGRVENRREELFDESRKKRRKG